MTSFRRPCRHSRNPSWADVAHDGRGLPVNRPGTDQNSLEASDALAPIPELRIENGPCQAVPVFSVMEEFFKDIAHEAAILAPKVGMGVVIFAAFWLASLLLRTFFGRLSRQADYNTAFIIKLAGRTGSIALMVFGAITALGTMGINVSALVAGLGLTGFALGFALKDILSNLMAGVLILLYRPFRVSDYIVVAGNEGIVTEIDLRYTTLQKEGQIFLVPNSVLFTNSIGVVESKRRRISEEPAA